MNRFRKLQRQVHDATLHIHGDSERIVANTVEGICIYLAEDEEQRSAASENSAKQSAGISRSITLKGIDGEIRVDESHIVRLESKAETLDGSIVKHAVYLDDGSKFEIGEETVAAVNEVFRRREHSMP